MYPEVRLCKGREIFVKKNNYISDSSGLSKFITVQLEEDFRTVIRTVISAELRFAKLQLNKPQDFCNKFPWTDKSKVEMFVMHSTMFGQTSSISTQTPHTNCKARCWGRDYLGLFCTLQALSQP